MTAVSSVYAQRFLITIFLISLGIYLFLATVTYTPFDPGWMHISSDTQQVSNASGVAGAWIADLLFGFLGWGSLLIPVFLFTEAIQIWWPRSFLSYPFRYAAQFFMILTCSSLLYLLWNVPTDTLDNASGGIIGYELGQSLSQLLTIYGAVIFLIALGGVLFTLAFGIQWNKTWVMLKATPAYLQELFYKNVPESESAYDLTETTAKQTKATNSPVDNRHNHMAQQNSNAATTTATVAQVAVLAEQGQINDPAAERLFDDILVSSQSSSMAKAPIDDAEFEKTIEKAHQLERETQRIVPTGEVWKALQHGSDHNSEIDALLKSAQDDEQRMAQRQANQNTAHSEQTAQQDRTGLDWDNDLVFDELLEVVPNGQTASDQHRPFNHDPFDIPQDEQHPFDVEIAAIPERDRLVTELDALATLATEAPQPAQQWNIKQLSMITALILLRLAVLMRSQALLLLRQSVRHYRKRLFQMKKNSVYLLTKVPSEMRG